MKSGYRVNWVIIEQSVFLDTALSESEEVLKCEETTTKKKILNQVCPAPSVHNWGGWAQQHTHGLQSLHSTWARKETVKRRNNTEPAGPFLATAKLRPWAFSTASRHSPSFSHGVNFYSTFIRLKRYRKLLRNKPPQKKGFQSASTHADRNVGTYFDSMPQP